MAVSTVNISFQEDLLNQIDRIAHADKEKIDYFINSLEEIGNKIIPKIKIKNGSRDKESKNISENNLTLYLLYSILTVY